MDWITDRLPDKNGQYLVTGRQGGISILRYTDGSWCRKWAVLAWMPLPEPYEAETSEWMSEKEKRYIDACDMAIEALEQESSEDAISRKAAINAMIKIEQDDIEQYGCEIPEGFDSSPAIEALKNLPSVTPQYTDMEIQKMQELEQAEIQKACELEQDSILDKIQAEIAVLDDANYDYEGYYKAVTDALKIIYKYRAKSEDKECK